MTPHVQLLEGSDPTELKLRARALGGASRSYCGRYALVAWHDGPVGVDIERVLPCGTHFAESITTPDEREYMALDDPREIISLWSGKEALAKALGNAVAYDPRRLDAPAGWPDGVNGAWHAQALDLPGHYVGWLCWQER